MGKPDESSSSQQDERTFDAAIPAGSGAEPSSSVPRGNDEDPEKEEDDGWVYDSNEEEEDEMILIRGADVSGHGAALDLPEGTEALMRAAEEGDSDALRDAIQGVSVALDSPGEDGNTALHLACLYGHTACVELLLAAGAAIEARDEDGAIPLHDACAGGGWVGRWEGGWVGEWVGVWVGGRAGGWAGGWVGFLNVIGMLLAAASDAEQRRRMIAAQDSDGDTPLHNAARGEHPSVCRLLLDAGANPAAPNHAAQVPWQLVEDDTRCLAVTRAPSAREQPRSPVRPAAQRAAAAHAATAALCPAEQHCPGRAAPPSPSRPPATTTAAAAARATAAAGGGAAGSTGGAAGAGGAGPTTDRYCLSWPLSRQLQQLWVDSSGHCLSRTTPPLSSFRLAAALGSSESAVAPCAGESAAALGAPESADALDAITPLAAPVSVSLADPTGGPVVARSSTVLPCPAVPSGSLSVLQLPAFLSNLLSNAVLLNEWVDPFIPGGQRVAICKCSQTGRRLATFTRQPGSSLYTLTTASAQVAESGQVAASSRVSASGQLAASCSCRVLSNQTLLWHHRLGHPSLPRLRSMHSCLLVSGLPRSLPSLPRSPAPPCPPCVEGRQRAAPHSSEFPPTTAPLPTLHMDVWGLAPVDGTDQERYFLLVVDDYTRYTIVFPLRRKADVSGVLIPWIRATHRHLRERFRWDFPVLCLHSDRGGELSYDLLAEFCRDKGIRQSFTLTASPQQNGIAERCIGLSMETSGTLRWTGKVGDASVFWVWGALSLVLDAKASKLSSRTLRCVFLGFPTDAPPWQFYHPRERRVFSSKDVTFEESICFYRLHPHASHPVDPPPLVEHLEISSDSSGPYEGGDPAADDMAATRRSPRLETPPGFPPRPSSLPPKPAAVDSGAETVGAEPGGAETKREGSGGAGSGSAATGGAGSGGAGSRGAETRGADSGGAAGPSSGGAVGDPVGGPGAGQPPQPDLLETLSSQAICAWIVRRGSLGGGGYGPPRAGASSPRGTAGAGGTGDIAGGAGGAAGARGTRGAAGAGGAGATSPRGATGAGGAGPTSP
ncbi:unnamed protein product [Closterium sp. NIES-53]